MQFQLDENSGFDGMYILVYMGFRIVRGSFEGEDKECSK